MKWTLALVFAVAASLAGQMALAEQGKPVRTSRAVEILDAVCGKSLPRFRDAQKRAEALGLPFNGEGERTEDLGVWVKENAKGLPECGLSYGSVENAPSLVGRLEVLGEIQPTSGLSAKIAYRKTSYTAFVSIGQLRRSGRVRVVLSLVGK